MQGQSKKDSSIETVTNVGSGFFVALALNLTFLPLVTDGIAQQSLSIAVVIGVVYTSVSMGRSFLFRRIFNHLHVKRNLNNENI